MNSAKKQNNKERFMVLKNFNRIMLFTVLLFVILYFGKPFLVPLVTGALFAMLLKPVCQWFEKYGFKRGWAAMVVVLLTFFVIIGVVYVFINELISFGDEFTKIGERLSEMIDYTYNIIYQHFNISKNKQEEYLESQVAGLSNTIGKFVGGTIFSIISIVSSLLIVAIYTVLILICRNKIKQFILHIIKRYVGYQEVEHADDTVEKITQVSSRYIGGIFMVVLILSVIYFIGLSIIGVENALFFSLLAALINVIPYLGSVMGGAIVVLYTLITGDSVTTPIIVGVFFAVVQQVDSYVLTPKITGAQVKLGPLFTIMALLLGGMIWGISGMILFIPLLGICKVIFDEVKPLKPFGDLIGD